MLTTYCRLPYIHISTYSHVDSVTPSLPTVTSVFYYRWLAAGLHDKIISREVGGQSLRGNLSIDFHNGNVNVTKCIPCFRLNLELNPCFSLHVPIAVKLMSFIRLIQYTVDLVNQHGFTMYTMRNRDNVLSYASPFVVSSHALVCENSETCSILICSR